MKQFSFCRVCRQNHDKGKGHKYGVKHKQNLAEFLSKARKKIQDVRLHLTEAVRLQDEERRRENFWCSFCDLEIDERGSSYVRESAIQHLGSSPHITTVKSFWVEEGADVGERNRYIISKEDLLKWKEACDALTASVPKKSGVEFSGTNNIHSDTSQYNGRSHMGLGFRHSVSHVATVNDVQPLSVLTLGSSQKTVSAYDGAVVTTMGDQPWLSRLGGMASTHITTNGWHGVFGSSVDDRVIADFAAQSSPAPGPYEYSIFAEATTSLSHNSFPESSEAPGLATGGNAVEIQVPRGGWLPTTRHGSAQNSVSLLPNTTPSQFTVVAAGQDFASVICPPLLPGEGNVHSGATPPWLGPSDARELFVGEPSVECKPKQPLSRTQERKLAKLRPPNRVGAAWAEMRRAEIEREQRGETIEVGTESDATWLPNFGRVWQSGSRHDTRKEYEAERRKEAKRLGRPLGRGVASSAENTVKFQPYISKRQRRVDTHDDDF